MKYPNSGLYRRDCYSLYQYKVSNRHGWRTRYVFVIIGFSKLTDCSLSLIFRCSYSTCDGNIIGSLANSHHLQLSMTLLLSAGIVWYVISLCSEMCAPLTFYYRIERRCLQELQMDKGYNPHCDFQYGSYTGSHCLHCCQPRCKIYYYHQMLIYNY